MRRACASAALVESRSMAWGAGHRAI